MADTPTQPAIAVSSAQSTLRVPRKRITGLIEHIASAENARIEEVDVAVVDASTIAQLNRSYLRHAGPTDVLSFDLTDAGDTGLRVQIVVCAEVAAEQAPRHGNGVQRELLLYIAHGLLHQLGYDDQEPDASVRMSERQEALLDAFLAAERRRARS